MQSQDNRNIRVLIVLSTLAFVLSVTGCAGTKILDEPVELRVTQPLATISDENVDVVLDWVVVRDGPGTWARNADWDQYLFRVKNLSNQALEIKTVAVVDSLAIKLFPDNDRGDLVDSSKLTVNRYEDSDIEVKAGFGTRALFATGALATATGVATVAAIGPIIFSSVGTATSTAAAAGVGLVLAGPVIAVGGVMRWRNNTAVNNEIERRHTPLPLMLESDEERQLELFFPLAPSPRMIELTYEAATGEQTVKLDVREPLDGLHFVDE